MRIYLLAVFCALLILSCVNETTTQLESDPQYYANDYFPFTKSYTWTYTTNALSDSGKLTNSFDMRIDTTSFNNGVFYALLGRLSGNTEWGSIFAIKDSGGIVYSIGDNPPEQPFPLFKHQYSNSEGERDSIVVLGTKMETVKVDINIGNGTLSLWVAKGIGFVKESSSTGISLFTDDNASTNVLIQTTLQSLTK